jgi:hypothetical protein
MTKRARGFTLGWMCFPLTELANWKWGREMPEQMFAVGPMRFEFSLKWIVR